MYVAEYLIQDENFSSKRIMCKDKENNSQINHYSSLVTREQNLC